MKEIRYKDLSQGLKIAIIGGWLAWFSFVIGFFMGLWGY